MSRALLCPFYFLGTLSHVILTLLFWCRCLGARFIEDSGFFDQITFNWLFRYQIFNKHLLSLRIIKWMWGRVLLQENPSQILHLNSYKAHCWFLSVLPKTDRRTLSSPIFQIKKQSRRGCSWRKMSWPASSGLKTLCASHFSDHGISLRKTWNWFICPEWRWGGFCLSTS